ncbi:MAG: phosphoribosyl-AMP cyclohydrolase [Burkholderiaceae bacterium]|jgi:phosphoribosyl-AMP cyclohydrolase
MAESSQWLDQVSWDANGLVSVIVQERASGDVLMFAHMNREALLATLEQGEAVFWSRSRKRLWHKGEQSGHIQKVVEIRLDCDADALLLSVEQVAGIACHTGRHSCFFRRLEASAAVQPVWKEVEPVLVDPVTLYSK